MDNQIKNSIENITPSEGAEQRMYKNILQKAAREEARTRQKKSPMRILRIAIPAAACLCIAVIGISHINFPGKPPVSDPSESFGVEAESPFWEVSSAEEFKKIGIEIDAPDGSENIYYVIIDGKMASVDFDKDGHNYMYRASEQSGDFSGIYGDEISREPLDSETGAVLITQSGAEVDYMKIFWTDGKINYYLCNTDGANAEELKKIAYELFK